MATLSALVSGLDAELHRLGYKDSTLVWYRGCWRRLERFFAARGVEEFCLDVAMAWVDEACGFFDKERAGTLKQTDVYLFRVAQMLEDGTPVEQIADILGHQSVQSTGVYLKSTLGLLAKCALDPDASGRPAS